MNPGIVVRMQGIIKNILESMCCIFISECIKKPLSLMHAANFLPSPITIHYTVSLSVSHTPSFVPLEFIVSLFSLHLYTIYLYNKTCTVHVGVHVRYKIIALFQV